MKKFTPLVLAMLMAGCASTQTTETSSVQAEAAPTKTVKAKAETKQQVAINKTDKLILINSRSDFSENAQVPQNVIDECQGVTVKLSDAVVKYGNKHGLKVQSDPDVAPTQDGKVVKVSITGMYSAGNAFIGHRKSASVKAELFQNGQLLDTANYTRNSSGGFLGGFKGSCSVLEHTVNTLGSDVAKWLKKVNS